VGTIAVDEDVREYSDDEANRLVESPRSDVRRWFQSAFAGRI
jgi:hypothetical protein